MAPLVLDSPHSGHDFPADFDAIVSEAELRESEDCYVDELWTPTGTGGKFDMVLMRQQIVEFYRGACRDGGDWSQRFSAGDAGVADTGTTPTDAASDGG